MRWSLIISSTRTEFQEYSWLVEEILKNYTSKEEDGLSSAVDYAINVMSDDYIMKSFFKAQQADMKGMLLSDQL